MKKTNLVLGFMLIIGLTMSTGLMAGHSYSGGAGTSGDPYQIANLDDLSELCQTSGDWGEYFKQTADIDASATQYWDDTDDDDDGDLYNDTNDGTSTGNNEGFSPIADKYNTYFTGNYNGQGYTIDALFINRSSTSYIGLFGYTSGATIQNLGVTDVNITGDDYVGGLMGYNDSSIVSNSYSTGSVSGSKYVGGLMGKNNNNATISNSYSTGSVTGSGNYIGGLVGSNCSSSTVSNSYSTGSVSGNSDIGGLVGENYDGSTVSNSYSTGSVSGSGNVGGLVGYNTGTVNNSFWDTQTSGQSSSDGGTGKTTAEMKTENFSGWDWTDTWERIGYNYPRLQSNPDASLPVELTSFTAIQKNNTVILEWQTGSETDNLGFIIERKNNDNEFIEIASYANNEELKGAGNTSVRSDYTFTDNNVVSGVTYEYRISDVDYSGKVKILKTITINITENSTDIPKTYALNSAYPNPFNPTTTISYDLPKSSFVTISVYDITGNLVENIVNENKEAGSYSIKWNASNISSGIYLYRLVTNDFVSTKKLVLLK